MNRLKRIISTISLIAFLLNIALADYAFALAPAKPTDDIIGAMPRDVFEAKALLEGFLMKASGGSQSLAYMPVAKIAEALDREFSALPEAMRKKIRFFCCEIPDNPSVPGLTMGLSGLCVRCDIKNDRGRSDTIHLAFGLDRIEANGFYVEFLPESRYNELPQIKKEMSAKNIVTRDSAAAGAQERDAGTGLFAEKPSGSPYFALETIALSVLANKKSFTSNTFAAEHEKRCNELGLGTVSKNTMLRDLHIKSDSLYKAGFINVVSKSPYAYELTSKGRAAVKLIKAEDEAAKAGRTDAIVVGANWLFELARKAASKQYHLDRQLRQGDNFVIQNHDSRRKDIANLEDKFIKMLAKVRDIETLRRVLDFVNTSVSSPAVFEAGYYDLFITLVDLRIKYLTVEQRKSAAQAAAEQPRSGQAGPAATVMGLSDDDKGIEFGDSAEHIDEMNGSHVSAPAEARVTFEARTAPPTLANLLAVVRAHIAEGLVPVVKALNLSLAGSGTTVGATSDNKDLVFKRRVYSRESGSHATVTVVSPFLYTEIRRALRQILAAEAPRGITGGSLPDTAAQGATLGNGFTAESLRSMLSAAQRDYALAIASERDAAQEGVDGKILSSSSGRVDAARIRIERLKELIKEKERPDAPADDMPYVPELDNAGLSEPSYVDERADIAVTEPPFAEEPEAAARAMPVQVSGPVHVKVALDEAMAPKVAVEAGKMIGEKSLGQYKLRVPTEFFLNDKEFDDHKGDLGIGNRYKLDRVSGFLVSADEYVKNLINSVKEEDKDKVAALVPQNISDKNIDDLKKAGIRFIPVSDNIVYLKNLPAQNRHDLQANICAMMYVMRFISGEESSMPAAFTMARYYAFNFLDLDGLSAEEYVKAVAAGDIEKALAAMRSAVLRPIEKLDAKEQERMHENVSYPLIFA